MDFAFRRASFFLLPFALVSAAHAQDAGKPAQDGAITVTGKAQKPIKRAQHYIRPVLDLDDGQRARFADPVCPLVIGLPERYSAAIADRFRTVASAASVRMAKAKCAPNLMIVFVNDADTLISTLRKRHNAVFDDLDDGALHDAFGSGRIHAWRPEVTRDDMGNMSTDDQDPDEPVVFESDTQVMIHAVVVMNRAVALGKPVRQLGDYVVMRTLVGARPPASEISDMDPGLLAGLYRARDPYETGSDQAYRISRTMAGGSRH